VTRPSFVLAAYAAPAAVVWAAAGLLLTALPIATVALLGVAAYGLLYGLAEVSGASRPAAPGRAWQVPQDMMIGAGSRRRLLTWGLILGPGFLTRNPYAGFGVLPLLVASAGSLRAGIALAAAVGIAHGAGRALALLRDAASPADDPFTLLLSSLRWRRLDGLLLLMVAATAIACVPGKLG
jgi:hypothetical protein